MKKHLILSVLVLAPVWLQARTATTYQPWKAGDMEIHHICTGRGESNFVIMPDGTTLLIDAGEGVNKKSPAKHFFPDRKTSGTEAIWRYLKRVAPNKDSIDYFLLSHFHSDHIGYLTPNKPHTKGRKPDYMLSGITEVAEHFHFGKYYDRGYPSYKYPKYIKGDYVLNYRNFIMYQVMKNHAQTEQFQVGQLDQIKLLRNPRKYGPLFHIRNLSASGSVWTGNGTDVVPYYDIPANTQGKLSENAMSIGLRISYGPFSYFTAGDLYGAVSDGRGHMLELDSLAAHACGRVDVCKASHHATKTSMTTGIIRELKAANYISTSWSSVHPNPATVERMADRTLYPDKRNIIPTYTDPDLRTNYVSAPWMKDVCPVDGHIVVKVTNKGKKYSIYVLSADDDMMTIKKTYGPYKSGRPIKK